MANRFTLSWRISSADEGKILREFLREQGISKAALTDIKFKGGSILANGEEATVRFMLKEGDQITVFFPGEEPSKGIISEHIPLNILFEDDWLLIVSKPAGMSTIPSRDHPQGTLANGLIGYYEHAGLQATAHIVTRLDRDTSGLVLVAKHRHIHHLLSQQQKAGRVKRLYEAFAEGSIIAEYGIVEQPIARKSDSIIEREVNPEGQYACTNYRVIKRHEQFTHVELRLKTGRTHQIRVHMAFLGHPLLGDDLYGGNRCLIGRQALHCKELMFNHPASNEKLTFHAPLPEDMNRVVSDSKPV
ncbi:RluA family pseudouridine synthase [Bacillus sp. T33-2]|uniref:RluA family pseudouridine synthase n=1 Tax=Bacillus sp. T33-2 TaxID=2054168 RepID=UPI000C787FBA|nr:RluA family pseudouridine synthase [Bacillus sp. T33-2]PLR97748.1 RNA pseudouridine synthase [Bacillus sp. T33-2]